MTTKPHNYDKTQARRQAKRRSQFNQMREALREIERTTTDEASRHLAREALDEKEIQKDVD